MSSPAPEVSAKAVVPSSEPTLAPVALEPTPDTGFHLVATRRGEMWLHPMGGTVMLSAGVELLPLQPGESIRLDPQRLRGLEPPYDPEHRWTVRWAAGSWPDAVYLVDHKFFGCVNVVEAAYLWTSSGWVRKNPQQGLEVSARYLDLVTFGRGALARREYVLADSTRFDHACDDAALPSRLRRKLSAAERDSGIVTLAAEGSIAKGPQVPLRDAVAAPDGSVHVADMKTLMRWDRSGDRRGVRLPERVRGRGARVAHVSGSHVYLQLGDGEGLVRFDGERWTDIELPPSLVLLASAGGDGSPLWVSGRWTGAEGGSQWPLWRLDGDTWTHHALPPITFEGVARDEPPLDVWQIQIRDSGLMWLLAYHPHGGAGSSALLSTEPVPEVAVVPDYAQQWRQALEVNPEAKARVEAATGR